MTAAELKAKMEAVWNRRSMNNPLRVARWAATFAEKRNGRQLL